MSLQQWDACVLTQRCYSLTQLTQGLQVQSMADASDVVDMQMAPYPPAQKTRQFHGSKR